MVKGKGGQGKGGVKGKGSREEKIVWRGRLIKMAYEEQRRDLFGGDLDDEDENEEEEDDEKMKELFGDDDEDEDDDEKGEEQDDKDDDFIGDPGELDGDEDIDADDKSNSVLPKTDLTGMDAGRDTKTEPPLEIDWNPFPPFRLPQNLAATSNLSSQKISHFRDSTLLGFAPRAYDRKRHILQCKTEDELNYNDSCVEIGSATILRSIAFASQAEKFESVEATSNKKEYSKGNLY